MQRRYILKIGLAALLTVISVTEVLSQSKRLNNSVSDIAEGKFSWTQASFFRARQVLDAGINALGGMENIRRADKITINYKAVNNSVGQNSSFDAPPAESLRTRLKTLIDYSGGRFITEGQLDSPGGYKFNFRFVVTPKRSFNIDVLQNRRGNEPRNIGEQQKFS